MRSGCLVGARPRGSRFRVTVFMANIRAYMGSCTTQMILNAVPALQGSGGDGQGT